MISISSNIPALRAGNQLSELQNLLEQSSARLASGKRILSAADDPAGVGILSTLNAQAASFGAVERNLSSGMSIIDTASSALGSQQEILTQMKDLATQAASEILTTDQRNALKETFTELQSQLDSTVAGAEIFGQNLVNSAAADVNIQSGINAGDTFTIKAAKSDAATLGVDAASINIDDAAGASTAMTAIDAAVSTVAVNQSVLGAQQNGLKAISNNVQKVGENVQSAISRIQDVDVAKETSNLSQLQAKLAFSTSVLGLINQFPQQALSLLR